MSALILLCVLAAANVVYSLAVNEATIPANNNDACTDFYSFTCNSTRSHTLSTYNYEENIATTHSLFMPLFESVLRGAPVRMKSGLIEQQLYHNCMKFGEVDIKPNESWYRINDIFIHLLAKYRNKRPYKNDKEYYFNYSTWHELDEALAVLGFGHAYYDISVTTDPTNPSKNIILLRPPSLDDINSKKIIDLLGTLAVKLQLKRFHNCKEEYEAAKESLEDELEPKTKSVPDSESAFIESTVDSSKEAPANINDKINISKGCEEYNFDYSPEREKELNEQLRDNDDFQAVSSLNHCLPWSITASNNVINVEPPYNKSTIRQFNETYNKHYKSKLCKIDFAKAIKNTFNRLGIQVDEDEPIIVQNPAYFHQLARALLMDSNSEKDYAIRAKFVAENVRYIDWNYMAAMEPVDKSAFCLRETKLYGLSELTYEVLKSTHLKPLSAKGQVIMNNIAKVLDSKISEAHELSESEKIYLKSKLQELTQNAFNGNWNGNLIANYYEDYEVTGDYFVDIHNYKNMLRNKALRKLRETPTKPFEYSPFSINEIGLPRNRFMLHTLFSAVAAKSELSTRETIYPTFGVNTAVYLLSLLRENRFELTSYFKEGSEWLIPRHRYPPEVVDCFVSDDQVVSYGYNNALKVVSESFGLNIAYEAMLNDPKATSPKNFFTAYTMSKCNDIDRKVARRILSNLQELQTAFYCSNTIKESKKCELTFQS